MSTLTETVMSAIETAAMAATPPTPCWPSSGSPATPPSTFVAPALQVPVAATVLRPDPEQLRFAYQNVLSAESSYRMLFDEAQRAGANAEAAEKAMTAARCRLDELVNEARKTWRHL